MSITIESSTSASSTPVPTPPESPSVSGKAPVRVEWKWPPLERDYTAEFQSLAALTRLTLTKAHPLQGKKPSTVKLNYNAQSQSSANNGSPSGTDGASSTAALVDDPLSALKSTISASTANDPLSVLSAHSSASSSPTHSQKPSIELSASKPRTATNTGVVSADYESWRERRLRILTRYTTNKKISVKAAFLDEDKVPAKASSDGSGSGGSVKSTRLEELEAEAAATTGQSQSQSQSNGTGSTGGLTLMSQKEFSSHISEQGDKLRASWDAGERVTSLKIAIQCAKLLGDGSSSAPLSFYPSGFVSLTTILDSFGDLVFDRIRDKGSEIINALTKQRTSESLPPSFSSNDTAAQAKETCRNWFYKTACIRELLPRLYVDMCLLKCYRFIDDQSQFLGHFQRLAAMIRGIGDPLIAIYALAYLAIKMGDFYQSFHSDNTKSGEAKHVPKEFQAVLVEAYINFINVFAHHTKTKFLTVRAVREERCTSDEYIELMEPALDWLAQNLGYQAEKEDYNRVFTEWKEKSNHAALLAPLIERFPKDLVGRTALQLTTIIFETEETAASVAALITVAPPVPLDGSDPPPLPVSLSMGKAQCLTSLGRAIVASPPPQPKHRLAVLNEVWKYVTKITNIALYMELAVIYINFLILYFSDREINIFLRDVIKHVKPNHQYKYVQHELAAIIINLMQHSKDLSATLKLDSFLGILDLLENKALSSGSTTSKLNNAKLAASKIILNTFRQKSFIINGSSDPVILHTLMELARSLHDNCDSLTFEDEKKQIAALILAFVNKVEFGRDVEGQLNFYTECRDCFRNLEAVLVELIYCVSLLTHTCLRFTASQQHNKKSAAFVRACMAFMHVTVPSFSNVRTKLRLLLLAAQTGLVHQMIGQSEACIKTAIALIHDTQGEISASDSDSAILSSPSSASSSASADHELIRYVLELQSFLLVFPGHPDHGPFYLVTGLINAINHRPQWQQPSLPSIKARFTLYLGLLTLFFAYSQKSFPYHISGVESNDSLYGGESHHQLAISNYLDIIMKELLDMLGALGEKTDLLSRQTAASLSMQLVNVLLDTMKIQSSQHATVLVKLLQLAQKNQAASGSDNYFHSTVKHLRTVKSSWTQEIIAKLNLNPVAPTPAATAKFDVTGPLTKSSASASSASASKPGAVAASSEPVSFGRMPSAGPQAAARPTTKLTGVHGPL